MRAAAIAAALALGATAAWYFRPAATEKRRRQDTFNAARRQLAAAERSGR